MGGRALRGGRSEFRGSRGCPWAGVAAVCDPYETPGTMAIPLHIAPAPPPSCDSVMPADSDASGAPATPRLLEQLMQIARTSALEEMASGFAHELNQPIGAIATFAQAAERMLARPEPMTAQALDVLRHISNEALNAGQGIRRIRKLFNDVTVARANCNHARRDRRADAGAGVAGESRWRAHGSGDRSRRCLAVSVDRLRIQHVLYTLVQNSLEAPRPAQRSARVRIEVTGDRYAVTTAVIDNGVGLSTEARAIVSSVFHHQGSRHGLGPGVEPIYRRSALKARSAATTSMAGAPDSGLGCRDF